jgi:hypothetical protein
MIEKWERWAETLHRLEVGEEDKDKEFYSRPSKKNLFVTIFDRKMTLAEATRLSGIDPSFFKKYRDKEIPVDDIIAELNRKWIKEKVKHLKQGMS